MKHILRISFVLAALLLVTALVAGPSRIGAALDQVQGKVQSAIDSQIDDPVALRRQMRKLEAEYPGRITSVRGDLAQLRHQIQQLERDHAVAQRVVELASQDRDALLGSVDSSVVTVAFRSTQRQSSSSHLRQVQSRANRMDQTILAYQQRGRDSARDLDYLRRQEERMTGILSQMETEYSQFRAQMMQLDRQVDTIERNDHLIALMEKRQQTLDSLSRYDAGGLQQLQGRLAQIRAEQEAKMEMLAEDSSTNSYEHRARLEMDSVPLLDTVVLVDPAF